jgi:hypothetical protein
MASFTMGLAMENLSWKFYMVNASYNFIFLIGVWFFWVETKGLTLEAVALKFETIEGLLLSSETGGVIIVANNDSKEAKVSAGSV